jgi:hypothetical protein
MPLWGVGGDGAISHAVYAARQHSSRPLPCRFVADEFDPEAMIQRFKERAQAVKNRPLPPVAGPDKKRFLERAQVDFMDFAMIGDASATLEDGVLTLRIDLRGG